MPGAGLTVDADVLLQARAASPPLKGVTLLGGRCKHNVVLDRIGVGIARRDAAVEFVTDRIGNGRPVGNVTTVARGALKGHFLLNTDKIGARPTGKEVSVAGRGGKHHCLQHRVGLGIDPLAALKIVGDLVFRKGPSGGETLCPHLVRESHRCLCARKSVGTPTREPVAGAGGLVEGKVVFHGIVGGKFRDAAIQVISKRIAHGSPSHIEHPVPHAASFDHHLAAEVAVFIEKSFENVTRSQGNLKGEIKGLDRVLFLGRKLRRRPDGHRVFTERKIGVQINAHQGGLVPSGEQAPLFVGDGGALIIPAVEVVSFLVGHGERVDLPLVKAAQREAHGLSPHVVGHLAVSALAPGSVQGGASRPAEETAVAFAVCVHDAVGQHFVVVQALKGVPDPLGNVDFVGFPERHVVGQDFAVNGKADLLAPKDRIGAAIENDRKNADGTKHKSEKNDQQRFFDDFLRVVSHGETSLF